MPGHKTPVPHAGMIARSDFLHGTHEAFTLRSHLSDRVAPMTEAIATRIGSSYRATRLCVFAMTVLGILA
jgi:hypothetical protein